MREQTRNKILAIASLVIMALVIIVYTRKVVIIVSESMEPDIRKGTIAFITKKPFEKVEVGDIICYLDTNRNIEIIHRVVTKDSGVLTTQGDANKSIDNCKVTQENYIGSLGINIFIADIVLEIIPAIFPGLLMILGIISLKIRRGKNEEQQEE